jgi:hypothetical protein
MRRMSTKKVLLIGCGSAAIVGIGMALLVWVGWRSSSARLSAKLARLDVKPDITMAASDLAIEFREDKEKADARYTGKVLELSGPLDVARKGAAGGYFVYMKPQDVTGTVGLIMCSLASETDSVGPGVKEGDQIVIRGFEEDASPHRNTIRGQTYMIRLGPCKVVKP